MVHHCYRMASLKNTVDKGFLLFALPFHASEHPDFSLIINAPNAIRKGLAIAPIFSEKFSAYSSSNSAQGQ